MTTTFVQLSLAFCDYAIFLWLYGIISIQIPLPLRYNLAIACRGRIIVYYDHSLASRGHNVIICSHDLAMTSLRISILWPLYNKYNHIIYLPPYFYSLKYILIFNFHIHIHTIGNTILNCNGNTLTDWWCSTRTPVSTIKKNVPHTNK